MNCLLITLLGSVSKPLIPFVLFHWLGHFSSHVKLFLFKKMVVAFMSLNPDQSLISLADNSDKWLKHDSFSFSIKENNKKFKATDDDKPDTN